jgi:hypothetical protein
MTARRSARLLAIGSVAALASGCGLGAGDTPAGVRLTVSEDFGNRPLIQRERPEAEGRETVMRLLQRNARVTTRYGGGFVQSIDGRGADRGSGRLRDWFFYVNGVESDEGAASVTVHEGDRIWWDRHDWGAAMRVPAVVGSFPEPFLHGIDGKRLPVRVECIDPRGAACRAAAGRLTEHGIVAARGGLQTSLTQETLRMLVGPWSRLRADESAASLEEGPRTSGVYARPARDGRSIAVLDDRGRVTRTLRAGAGLVAATRYQDGQPVWIVTGTDERGLRAAAEALAEDILGDHFAVAIAGGLGIGLPEVDAARRVGGGPS